MVDSVALLPILEVCDRERGYESGTVVASDGGQKSSECYVKRYFGGVRGAAL